MALKKRILIAAVAMLTLIVASLLLPQAIAVTSPSAKPTTCPTTTSFTPSPSASGIVRVADISKYFLDPRDNPKNFGYTGNNMASIQTFGYLFNTLNPQWNIAPLTMVRVSFTIIVPAGRTGILDEYVPWGFIPVTDSFRITSDFGAHYTSITPDLIQDGFIRIKNLAPGTYWLGFDMYSPKWGSSFASTNFAKLYLIQNGWVVFVDFENIPCSVVGTGIFTEGIPTIKDLNYQCKN